MPRGRTAHERRVARSDGSDVANEGDEEEPRKPRHASDDRDDSDRFEDEDEEEDEELDEDDEPEAEDEEDEEPEDEDEDEEPEDEEPEDEEDEPEQSERRARPNHQSSGRSMSASGAAEAGIRHLEELTNKQPTGVTSIESSEDGWVVGIEVVEDRRVPSSADVLAIYEAEIDDSGDLVAYRRVKRYSRGQGDPG